MEANVKLQRLIDKAKLTVADVQFAIDNWTDEDFPRRLETKIRRWFKDFGCVEKYADLQVQYAKIDEQSAKWLIDPCVEAQRAILHLKDDDDLALLVKRANRYTNIGPSLWKELRARGSEFLSERLMKRLAKRDDATNLFIRDFGAAAAASDDGEEKPARRKAKVTQGKPVRRGLTGTARSVKRASSKVDDDDQYALDDDDAETKPVRRTKKTVNDDDAGEQRPRRIKSSVSSKVRSALKPARSVKELKHVEAKPNAKKLRTATRSVRRPHI